MWLFDDAFDVQFQQFGFDPQPGGEPFPAAVAEASRPTISDHAAFDPWGASGAAMVHGLMLQPLIDPDTTAFGALDDEWLAERLDRLAAQFMGEDGFLMPSGPDDADTASVKTANTVATEPDVIIVVGDRPVFGGGAGGGGGSDPDTTDTTYDGAREEGDESSDESPGDDLEHPEKCASTEGAADQIRDKINGTASDGLELTRSSSQVEYGTFIVESNGMFGAVNDMIYTDGRAGQVLLNDNIPSDLGSVYGIIHNHTGFGTADRSLINFYSYPSLEDWISADQLVAMGVPADQLSIWMIAPDGSLREFQYADRASFTSLTEEEKMAGEGLPTSSTAEGCGSDS